MKMKKILLTLGSIAAVTAPISTVIACSENTELNFSIDNIKKINYFTSTIKGIDNLWVFGDNKTNKELNKPSSYAELDSASKLIWAGSISGAYQKTLNTSITGVSTLIGAIKAKTPFKDGVVINNSYSSLLFDIIKGIVVDHKSHGDEWAISYYGYKFNFKLTAADRAKALALYNRFKIKLTDDATAKTFAADIKAFIDNFKTKMPDNENVGLIDFLSKTTFEGELVSQIAFESTFDAQMAAKVTGEL